MPFDHATFYAYLTKKCRCDTCRAWWTAYWTGYRDERCRRTGEAFSARLGGFVPGKPCACGCGLTLPAASSHQYKKGHKLAAT